MGQPVPVSISWVARSELADMCRAHVQPEHCVIERRTKTLPSGALGAHSLMVTPHVESIILVYCSTTLF